MNLLERNKLWQENKENKIKKQKELKKDDGIEECTFAPKTFTKNYYRNKQSTFTNGSNKYVEWMNKAREEKELKK